jgi:predicted MFS family arabinose efflux permease
VGFAAIAAGNLVSAIAVSLPVLVAGRTLAGLGAGVVLAYVHAGAAQAPNPDRTFSAINFGVILVGVALYPMLGLLAKFGATAIFVVMSVVSVICFLPMLQRSTQLWQGSRLTTAGATKIGGPDARRATFGAIVFYVAEGTLWAYVVRLSVVSDVSAIDAGRLLSGTLALGLVGASMAGAISRRIGRSRPLIATLVCLSLVGWSLGNVSSELAYSVAVITFNLAFVFAVIYTSGLLADLDPSGRLAARIPTFRTFGNAVGPFLGALTLEFSGYGTFGTAVALLYLLSAALLFTPARPADRARMGH